MPRVARESRIASATTSRSLAMTVMSLAAIAASVPVPMATPRSAAARPAASLTPSPTMATTRPSCWSCLITASLPSGVTPERTSSIPTAAATLTAAPALSPVSSTGVSPSAFSREIASALVGRIVSPTVMTPRTTPSHATTTVVRPAASPAVTAAASSSGTVRDHDSSIHDAVPASVTEPSMRA